MAGGDDAGSGRPGERVEDRAAPARVVVLTARLPADRLALYLDSPVPEAGRL